MTTSTSSATPSAVLSAASSVLSATQSAVLAASSVPSAARRVVSIAPSIAPSAALSAPPNAAYIAQCMGYNDIWGPAPVDPIVGATPDGTSMPPFALSLPPRVGLHAQVPESTPASCSAQVQGNGCSGIPPRPPSSEENGAAVPAANVQTSVGSGRKGRRSGKRASSKTNKKASAVLEWSEIMVRDLMMLRYDTYAERFGKAKNNAAIREAWLLVATELSERQSTPISSEQCKNKLKWLKRKWAEYVADVRATGNSEDEVVEPPGLELMQEFWSGSTGMNAQTLADSEIDDALVLSDEEADEAVGGESSEQSSGKHGDKSKRRKTMGVNC